MTIKNDRCGFGFVGADASPMSKYAQRAQNLMYYYVPPCAAQKFINSVMSVKVCGRYALRKGLFFWAGYAVGLRYTIYNGFCSGAPV